MAKPRVVFLTIRDPDYQDEHVIDEIGDVDVEIIDIDLGLSFNAPKSFWYELGEAGGEEWLAGTREEVAHLPEDSDVRQRVEELCRQLEERK